MSAVAFSYIANPSAQATYNNDSIIIKNAYLMNGVSYDIQFKATLDTIQRLHSLGPSAIQSLQEQMGAYLEAAQVGDIPPEDFSFELESNNDVSAVHSSGQRRKITDAIVNGHTVREIAKIFHDAVAKVQPAPLGSSPTPTLSSQPSPQPAPPSIPPAPAADKPVSGLDVFLTPARLASKFNLLTLSSLPLLVHYTGIPAIISGSIGLLQHGSQAYIKLFASGKNLGEGLEEVVKTLYAISEIIIGMIVLGTFGVTAASLGPIICLVVASLHLIINLKDAISKQLTKALIFEMLRNVAMITAAILLITGVLSNPVTLLVVGALTLIAMAAYMKANTNYTWGDIALYLIPFIVTIALQSLGMPYMDGNTPYAVWIGTAIAVVKTAVTAYTKREGIKNVVNAIRSQVGSAPQIAPST